MVYHGFLQEWLPFYGEIMYIRWQSLTYIMSTSCFSDMLINHSTGGYTSWYTPTSPWPPRFCLSTGTQGRCWQRQQHVPHRGRHPHAVPAPPGKLIDWELWPNMYGDVIHLFIPLYYIYIYIISSTIVYPSTHLYMMIYRAQIFTKCSANASECVHSAPKSPELHPCLPWPIVLLRHPLLKLFVRVDAEARICVLWSAYNTCL